MSRFKDWVMEMQDDAMDMDYVAFIAKYGEVNIDSFKVNDVGTGTGEVANMVLYLFNFPNAEYSFITQETTQIGSTGLHRGRQGGAVHTVASASDGMEFKMASGNIASGTFSLYGLRK